jgi:hypothetical protein
MGLRLRSPLINMRGGVLGARHIPTRHHATILAATSSRPKPETLATREVLAHLRVTFHPCLCGLRGGVAAVAAVLIRYGGKRSLLGRGRGGGDCD